MQQYGTHAQYGHAHPGQRPTTPTPGAMRQSVHGMQGPTGRPGSAPHVPPGGPTMGNPPPPYPVQQPSVKSPKGGAQSPRPSPKPSPLHPPHGPSPSQAVQSPHGAVGSVGSPHPVQSPHYAGGGGGSSRADTPQMSPRPGAHTPSGSAASGGSQPGTPQSGHPGLATQSVVHPGQMAPGGHMMMQQGATPATMPPGSDNCRIQHLLYIVLVIILSLYIR